MEDASPMKQRRGVLTSKLRWGVWIQRVCDRAYLLLCGFSPDPLSVGGTVVADPSAPQSSALQALWAGSSAGWLLTSEKCYQRKCEKYVKRVLIIDTDAPRPFQSSMEALLEEWEQQFSWDWESPRRGWLPLQGPSPVATGSWLLSSCHRLIPLSP